MQGKSLSPKVTEMLGVMSLKEHIGSVKNNSLPSHCPLLSPIVECREAQAGRVFLGHSEPSPITWSAICTMDA